MSFQKVLKDIKSLKIQGAENIAIEAVKSLKLVLKNSKATSIENLNKELNVAIKQLILTRPTEPAMRNSLNFILNSISVKNSNSIKDFTNELNKRINVVLTHFSDSKKKIIEVGSKKIKKSYIVFTHCHSSTVVDILINAKKRKINFEVHNTETRPLFQGRKTALELSKSNILVTHYIDSAAMFALKKADIVLIGADAIQSDGRVINKIGSLMFAEIAFKLGIPVYCCMNSWKFDPKTIFGEDEKIENRCSNEIWEKCPKNVKICNPAFDFIEPSKISGIISELGIYRPSTFVEVVERSYPWLSY
ncbi:MAG: translation initiation factor eIF-2B [Nanoarchaeota archaeon]